jgi:hypothetical protein
MAAIQRAPRVYGERSTRLDDMSDADLLKRYRLDREGIEFVVNLVEGDIAPTTRRNHALDAQQQTQLTLRYLATGKCQLCNGDDHGVSQPSVSKAVNMTIDSLSSDQTVQRFIHIDLTCNFTDEI